MALALSDVISVTIRGDLFGQTILTILHYAVSVPVAGGTVFGDLTDIAHTIGAGLGGVVIKDTYLAAAGPQYTLQRVRAQRVAPTRSVYADDIVGESGTHADATKTVNVAASILKRSETPGRMGLGRVQYGPIPGTKLTAGDLDAGYVAGELTDLANALAANLTTAARVITLVPVVYNPAAASPFFSVITSWVVQSAARTMHRRTLRLGE